MELPELLQIILDYYSSDHSVLSWTVTPGAEEGMSSLHIEWGRTRKRTNTMTPQCGNPWIMKCSRNMGNTDQKEAEEGGFSSGSSTPPSGNLNSSPELDTGGDTGRGTSIRSASSPLELSWHQDELDLIGSHSTRSFLRDHVLQQHASSSSKTDDNNVGLAAARGALVDEGLRSDPGGVSFQPPQFLLTQGQLLDVYHCGRLRKQMMRVREAIHRLERAQCVYSRQNSNENTLHQPADVVPSPPPGSCAPIASQVQEEILHPRYVWSEARLEQGKRGGADYNDLLRVKPEPSTPTVQEKDLPAHALHLKHPADTLRSPAALGNADHNTSGKKERRNNRNGGDCKRTRDSDYGKCSVGDNKSPNQQKQQQLQHQQQERHNPSSNVVEYNNGVRAGHGLNRPRSPPSSSVEAITTSGASATIVTQTPPPSAVQAPSVRTSPCTTMGNPLLFLGLRDGQQLVDNPEPQGGRGEVGVLVDTSTVSYPQCGATAADADVARQYTDLLGGATSGLAHRSQKERPRVTPDLTNHMDVVDCTTTKSPDIYAPPAVVADEEENQNGRRYITPGIIELEIGEDRVTGPPEVGEKCDVDCKKICNGSSLSSEHDICSSPQTVLNTKHCNSKVTSKSTPQANFTHMWTAITRKFPTDMKTSSAHSDYDAPESDNDACVTGLVNRRVSFHGEWDRTDYSANLLDDYNSLSYEDSGDDPELLDLHSHLWHSPSTTPLNTGGISPSSSKSEIPPLKQADTRFITTSTPTLTPISTSSNPGLKTDIASKKGENTLRFTTPKSLTNSRHHVHHAKESDHHVTLSANHTAQLPHSPRTESNTPADWSLYKEHASTCSSGDVEGWRCSTTGGSGSLSKPSDRRGNCEGGTTTSKANVATRHVNSRSAALGQLQLANKSCQVSLISCICHHYSESNANGPRQYRHNHRYQHMMGDGDISSTSSPCVDDTNFNGDCYDLLRSPPEPNTTSSMSRAAAGTPKICLEISRVNSSGGSTPHTNLQAPATPQPPASRQVLFEHRKPTETMLVSESSIYRRLVEHLRAHKGHLVFDKVVVDWSSVKALRAQIASTYSGDHGIQMCVLYLISSKLCQFVTPKLGWEFTKHCEAISRGRAIGEVRVMGNAADMWYRGEIRDMRAQTTEHILQMAETIESLSNLRSED